MSDNKRPRSPAKGRNKLEAFDARAALHHMNMSRDQPSSYRGATIPSGPTVVDANAADIAAKTAAFQAAAGGGGGTLPSASVALVAPGLALVPPGGVAPPASGALTLVAPGSHQLALLPPSSSNDRKAKHTQLARESRRVLAQNFPRGVTQDQIRSKFLGWADVLRRSMLEDQINADNAPGDPRKTLPADAAIDVDAIWDVFLNSHVGAPFAFIEFSTDDIPAALIQQCERKGGLDFHSNEGILYKLNVKRPSHYRPMGKADPRKVMALGMNNPEELKDMLHELFSSLGSISVFAVIPGRGVYMEYDRETEAAAAVKAFNGEDIGGRLMIVQTVSEAMRFSLASLGVPVSGLEDDLVEEILDPKKEVMKSLYNLQQPLGQALQTFVHTHDHLKKLWPFLSPTCILGLFNMVDVEELEEDKDYHALVMDISAEVEKYGRVKQIIIPRNPPPAPTPPAPVVKPEKPKAPLYPDEATQAAFNEEVAKWQTECDTMTSQYDRAFDAFRKARDAWDALYWDPLRGHVAIGRVFVEFETPEEAAEAQRQIAGKLFNGRTIITSFLFEDVLYPPADPDAQVDERGRPLMLEAGPAAAPADEASSATVAAPAAASNNDAAKETTEDID